VTFGERLRKEREKRNITLDDVSITTKIGTRMLRALEEEKFDQLPGGIFNKGFVRAYARYLSIDEDQAVADYLEAAGEAPPPPQQNRNSPPRKEASESFEPEMESRRRSFPWGTVAAFILAVAIGLTIWRHNTSQDQSPTTSPSTPSTTQQPAQTQQPNQEPLAQTQQTDQSRTSTQPEVSPATAQPQVAAANPHVSSSPQTSAQTLSPSIAQPSGQTGTTRPTTASPTSTAPSPTDNALASAPIPPGSFAVLIDADDDSWISITADGRVLFQGTMVAPAQRLVHAQQAITIRAGNIGALNLSFNGKKLPTQGDTGEVKTLTFGPTGLQPPAPKPPVQ
jgi:cytoskeleton protein RodZ